VQLLGSCSGGGGGGGGGNTNQTPLLTNLPTEFVFTGVEGTGPEAKSVIIFREGNGSPINNYKLVNSALKWMDVSVDYDRVTDELFVAATPVFVDGAFTQNIATLPATQTYTGYSTFSYIRDNGQTGSVDITIRYEPIPALTAPDQIVLNIDSLDSAKNVLDKTFDIGNVSSVPDIAWTATAADSWLLLTNGSGNTGVQTQEQVSLDTSQTDTFRHGEYRTSVTFNYTTPVKSSIKVPVLLKMMKPRVEFVAPYVALENTEVQVILRGGGFNALIDPQVLFGTEAGTKVQVISDTELRVTHPPLTPDSYPVQVKGTNYTMPSDPRLLVVPAPNYSYAYIPGSVLSTPVAPKRVVYDAERHAVYTFMENFIQWYQYTDLGWTHTLITKGGHVFKDFDVSPDGSYFYILGTNGDLDKYDVATFATASLAFTDSVYLMDIRNAGDIAFANDGSVIVPHASAFSGTTIFKSRYDTRVGRSTDMDRSAQGQANDVTDVRMRFSANGQRGIVGYQASGTVEPPVEYYDATLNQIADTGLTMNVGNLSVDRTGNKCILNTSVYDANFQLLGKLPDTAQVNIISQDGLWAYVYEESPNRVLRKYNLSTVATDGFFVEQGVGLSVSNSPGGNALMAISPDGGSLFIVGDNGLVVSPSP